MRFFPGNYQGKSITSPKCKRQTENQRQTRCVNCSASGSYPLRGAAFQSRTRANPVNLIFRDPVHDARRCGQVSLWRITREASREELGRGGEVEAVQDVTLAAGQSHGMDDAAQVCVFLHQGTDPKSAKDAFRSQALVGLRRMVGNGLAILTLQEVVGGQADLEQIDEGLDPLGRLEKQWPNGQGRFPLVMGLFHIALLFEVCEQGVGTLGEGSSCQQGGITVVAGVGQGSLFVVIEDEALAGSSATTWGRRQGRLLRGREGHEFPAEVAGDLALANDFGGTLMNLGWIEVATMAIGHSLGDAFQAGANFGNSAGAFLLANFLVGAAENEDDAAGNAVAVIGVSDVVAQHGEFVVFPGQG